MRRGKEGATGGAIHITVTLLLHEQKYRTCTGNLSQPHNIRQMGTPVSVLALRQPTGEVRVPRSGGTSTDCTKLAGGLPMLPEVGHRSHLPHGAGTRQW